MRLPIQVPDALITTVYEIYSLYLIAILTVVHALAEGRHADKEKAVKDFVKKYGKKRICKYVAPEFKKKDLSDEEAKLKKSCEDDEQGDDDFAKVAQDNFVGSHHISS
jgi:hypothetical protein